MLRKFRMGWLKQQEGTTAVEFSLLAIPYVFLTAAILELSMMYTAASLLEGATGSAARLIRTGQLQQSDEQNQEDLFRQAICNYATILINCDDVFIEVQTMDSFSDYEAMQPQYDEDGDLIPAEDFDAGGSNDRVLIRVAYRYHMMTPLVGPLLAGPDNSKLFMSTIVLQSEPYQFEGS